MTLAPVDASVTVRLVYRPEPVVIQDSWAKLEIDRVVVEYTVPAAEDLDEHDSPDPYTRTWIKGWPLRISGPRDKRAKERSDLSFGPESARLELLKARFGIDPIADAEALLAPQVFPSVDTATG